MAQDSGDHGEALPPFEGVVLCGGSSRRMGRDKACVPVDGVPLAVRVARALTAAGAVSVRAVGGDEAVLGAHGLAVERDRYPGEGPLGGVVTALRGGDAEVEIVVVLACDLWNIGAAEVRAVVGALGAAPDAEAAAPVADDGRPQLLTAAFRRRVLSRLESAFTAGERAVRRGFEGARWVPVEGLDPERLVDADEPWQLPGGDQLLPTDGR